MSTTVLVIGGGPGGYSAAIRAAQLGYQVVVAEQERIGGTCLNRGCIPTKVFIEAAKTFEKVQHGSNLGITYQQLDFDPQVLLERKNEVVETLVSGVETILQSYNISVLTGTANFIDNHKVEVAGQQVEADYIIIATGSKDMIPPISGSGVEQAMTSKEALELDHVPKNIAIIGGGVIGAEFSEIFTALGSEVYLYELLPRLIPNEDQDISAYLQELIQSKGVQVRTDTQVKNIDLTSNGKFHVQSSEEITVDQVLIATGRQPVISNLSLENTDVQYDKSGIIVNDQLKTSVDHIYAIGDVVAGSMQLAHLAMYQGEAVMEVISGLRQGINDKLVPRCVYTLPEIASVGSTEKELTEQGQPYQVGQFPMYANGKALLSDHTQGLVKVLYDPDYQEILGVQIIGDTATEMIGESTLSINLECTLEEVIDTIHPHPTVSESLREAHMQGLGRAIHLPG